MIVQVRPQRHRAFYPEIGPLEHVLPQGQLTTGRIHPVHRFPVVFSCKMDLRVYNFKTRK